MDSIETLKQKLIDELVSIDGEINGVNLIHFRNNALELGLDEIQFNSLLKEAGNLAQWKKRKKDKGAGPVADEPHVIVFDEKVVSLAQLGQVLFENPEKVQKYLYDDTLLKANVNYLTNNDVNKIFKILKIYKSESDVTKRYLKIIYYLNPSLPYRIGGDTSANIGDLLNKSFQNYDHYKHVFTDFENGRLQVWLKETKQLPATDVPGNNDLISFLNFIYGIDAGYPFYLNLELFLTPVELIEKTMEEPYLKEAIIDSVNQDGLLVWLTAVEDLSKTANYGTPGSAYQSIAAETVIDAITTLRITVSGGGKMAEPEPILLKETEITEPVKIDVPENVPEPVPVKRNTGPVQLSVDPGQQSANLPGKLNPTTRILQSSKGPIILASGIVAVIILVLLYLVFKPIGNSITASVRPKDKDSRQQPQPTPAINPKQADLVSQSASLYNQGNEFYQQKNYKEALGAFRKAASAVANAKAECMIGNIYYMGLGVTQSDSTALKWYLKSAEKKNPSATYSLGLIYANGGKEVKRDILKAYQNLAWVVENATDEATKNSAKEKLKEINEH